MDLDRILGQENLKQKISNSILSNTFPQSKLFVDKDGYGGLNLAIEISRGLLKKSIDYSGDLFDHPDLYISFPSFSSFKDNTDFYRNVLAFIKQNPYGDYMNWSSFMGNTTSQGSLKVSDVEKIQEKSLIKSFLGGNKVFILWGVETMLPQASNRLLKILEEPPKNSFYILVTNNLHNVLPTIISRCQISTLNPISFDEIYNYLNKDFSNKDLKLISNSSRGSISRALNYAQEESESITHEKKIVECLRFAFLAKKSKSAVLDLVRWSEQIASNTREQQKEFLSFCSYLVREAMLISYNSKKIGAFLSSTDFNIEKLSPFIHSKNIIDLVDLIEDAHYCVSRNVNSKLIFTNFAINLTKLLNVKED